MITNEEKNALLEYLEFLLIEQLFEPIINKHIADIDTVNASCATIYKILNELDETVENYRIDRISEQLKRIRDE